MEIKQSTKFNVGDKLSDGNHDFVVLQVRTCTSEDYGKVGTYVSYLLKREDSDSTISLEEHAIDNWKKKENQKLSDLRVGDSVLVMTENLVAYEAKVRKIRSESGHYDPYRNDMSAEWLYITLETGDEYNGKSSNPYATRSIEGLNTFRQPTICVNKKTFLNDLNGRFDTAQTDVARLRRYINEYSK